MQMAEQALAGVKEKRAAAVADTIARVKQIEQEQGVTREALENIKRVLIELGNQTELFPDEAFSPHDKVNGNFPLYRLSEDQDHRFALYLSTSIGSKDVPPHNHTTWAVIAGVKGEEENRFYERVDDGSVEGRGKVRQSGGDTVVPGSGVCLMPEDIHSIHPRNETPSFHLHLYGLALEQLHERITFDVDAGTYRVFPASSNIRDAR